MIRKNIIGLSLAPVLLAAGCAYDPVSKDNTGRYIPEPPPVISEPLNLPVTNFDRRAPVPQKCKELGLSNHYWRTDNTVLGLQAVDPSSRVLSVVSTTASTCYDIVRIDSNTFTYPGVKVKYVDDTTLEVSVNITNENLLDYKFVADERFGSLVTIENVSTSANPVFRLHLKERTLYAVEYRGLDKYRTEVRIFLAHTR